MIGGPPNAGDETVQRAGADGAIGPREPPDQLPVIASVGTVAVAAVAVVAVLAAILVVATAQPVAAATVADTSAPTTVADGQLPATVADASSPASATTTTPAQADPPTNAPAAVQSDDGPRAEAGVDQVVTRGATVLLDATPSFSPDGAVTDYEWTVHAPDGSTVEPDCEVDSCRLANFTAVAAGEYTVELTVTDDADRTATDAIYVTTQAANEFGVELTGPDGVAGAQTATLTADVDAGNATLQHLVWYDEDGELANQSLSGLGGEHELQSVVSSGTTYAVAVHAADGRVVGDTWTAPAATSGPVQDYPYIEGPTELTGEPDYESDGDYYFEDVTYRVHASGFDVEPQVIWSHDGTEVGKGRYYTGDFAAGKQRLTATVRFAENEFDQERFDGVGGDVSANLAVFLGNRSASEVIQADSKPQVMDYSASSSGGWIDAIYTIEESDDDEIQSVKLEVDGTVIHRSSPSESKAHEDIFVEAGSSASGPTRVKLTAVDSSGQRKVAYRHVQLPASNVGSDHYPPSSPEGDRRGYYP